MSLDKPTIITSPTALQAHIKMRRIANGMLLAMTAIFLVSNWLLKDYSWLNYVKAFAEAGMVGAIADWFAVTALFRHPLGIPIPHTAIIANKKDRIAQSLGNFIRDNFIQTENLQAKLKTADLEKKLSEWLSIPKHSELIAEQLSALIPKILHTFKDEDIKDYIEKNAQDKIKSGDIAQGVSKLLNLLSTNERQQLLFTQSIQIAEKLLLNNKDWIKEKIHKESPWFVPRFVENKMYKKLITSAETNLEQVQKDENHPYRQQFQQAVIKFIEDLQTSPAFINKIEEIKEEIIKNPETQSYILQLWGQLKQYILLNVSEKDSQFRIQLQQTTQGLLNGLIQDENLRQRISNWAVQTAVETISEYRNEISEFITNTIQKWDAKFLTEKIEQQVGKDLQFIRINGTLVGGLVGLFLYMVSQLF